MSVFNVGVYERLGRIVRLRIWHDSGGEQPSWHLDKIVVEDVLRSKRYNYILNGSWNKDKYIAIQTLVYNYIVYNFSVKGKLAVNV